MSHKNDQGLNVLHVDPISDKSKSCKIQALGTNWPLKYLLPETMLLCSDAVMCVNLHCIPAVCRRVMIYMKLIPLHQTLFSASKRFSFLALEFLRLLTWGQTRFECFWPKVTGVNIAKKLTACLHLNWKLSNHGLHPWSYGTLDCNYPGEVWIDFSSHHILIMNNYLEWW